MGKREKKTGKGRLDKYYRLAKEQGYRARSAFKLIQLNKRYQFLESARCCIDLCAAPGGWLQVAAKWMPANSLILGVDLVPIKPIPKVVTATEDIRTQSCRMWLRSELKDWKADVVLHDGAPNVGTAWVQDAFSQSELVLHSLKLATEMLAQNGTFITKVFRSKDYNSLLYIFNQLFKKVEATKPPSSRNVSAEIFVVCQGYLAPKKIDPRLLDPAHVFKDVDLTKKLTDDQAEASSSKLTPNAQNVFKPEKKRRTREGYDEGDYTLHKSSTASALINAKDPVSILGVANCIKFDDSQQDQAIYKLKATTAEIKTTLTDLKVLGKGDFKKILKWRTAVRELLGIDSKPVNQAPSEAPVEVEPLDEEQIMKEELARIQTEKALENKRERRRLNEKRTRDVQRMQLQMTTPMDIGIENTDGEVFGLQNVDSQDLSSDDDMEDIDGAEGSESPLDTDPEEDEDEEELSEDEAKLQTLEEGLDLAYDEYQENQLRKDAKRKAREEARRSRHNEDQESEWAGCNDPDDQVDEEDDEIGSGDDIEVVRQKRAKLQKGRQENDDDSDSEGEDVTLQAARIVASRKTQRSTIKPLPAKKPKLLVDFEEQTDNTVEAQASAADLWFDQPVFKAVGGVDGLIPDDSEGSDAGQDESRANDESICFDDDEDRNYLEAPETEDSDSEMEVDGPTGGVWDDELPDPDEKNAEIIREKGLLTPQAIQLALDLVNRKKTKDQLVDSGFKRDAFFDDKNELPTWFLDDEMRHFREHVPVTKEAVKILRDKMRALNARPIKKIAEAKGRKKLRTLRRLEKAQSKANTVNETNDLTEKEKSLEIEKLMSRMHKSPKTKSDIKIVVAKGANRGQKGRPRGVKGRYKMVDARGRKELRAQKRQERASSKRKRK
ncbi:AdoMet-dependent rRNA methyltransferase spb1 [Puccinia graminis f. sp. tritici]|uniref:AdoMet-dependent rRNA methyltransferase spb1 n=1 Tax=Puccinia graminis f. sp. tritici TaxID=56615 RepID=A0A5B0PIL4_PUCGR|nr:AdoMet-dependent rRNA methyltransferase spb1 [Puccinia graminis f. sp. tritici]